MLDFYLQSLVYILSELLSERTLEYWPRLETLTNESPHYLHSLFAIYMSTLTGNMRDTYTQPFETIADNLGIFSICIYSIHKLIFVHYSLLLA